MPIQIDLYHFFRSNKFLPNRGGGGGGHLTQ